MTCRPGSWTCCAAEESLMTAPRLVRSCAGLAIMLLWFGTRIYTQTYWCPMHPDQRADAPGTCPVCRMTLVLMPPANFATYPVDLRATPTTAGARLRLAVRAPGANVIVRRFAM